MEILKSLWKAPSENRRPLLGSRRHGRIVQPPTLVCCFSATATSTAIRFENQHTHIGTAVRDAFLLACRQLSLGRPDLPVRQSLASRSAEAVLRSEEHT